MAVTLVSLLLGGAEILAQADDVPPSHSCEQPSKPYDLSNSAEVENFSGEVEEYKNCINEFVEEQNEAIRNHQQAAQDAINEWNNFARGLQ